MSEKRKGEQEEELAESTHRAEVYAGSPISFQKGESRLIERCPPRGLALCYLRVVPERSEQVNGCLGGPGFFSG
jgi:hypothetical protein